MAGAGRPASVADAPTRSLACAATGAATLPAERSRTAPDTNQSRIMAPAAASMPFM